MKIALLDKYQFISSFVNSKLGESNQVIRIPLEAEEYSVTFLTNFFRRNKPDVIINCEAYGGGIHYVSKKPAEVFHYNSLTSLVFYQAVSRSAPNAFVINLLPNCVYPYDKELYEEKDWRNGPVHDSVFAMGYSKRFLQTTSKAYAKQFNIKSANLIVPNGYGPEREDDPQKTHALNGMIIRMIRDKKNKKNEFVVWGSGFPKREWLFMEDLASFIKLFLRNPNEKIQPLNIAQKKVFSIAKTAEIIKKEVGFKGKIIFDKSMPDGTSVKEMDNTLFKSLYPNFEFTPIEIGIKKTIKFYKDYLQAKK